MVESGLTSECSLVEAELRCESGLLWCGRHYYYCDGPVCSQAKNMYTECHTMQKQMQTV